jgi:SAM-dependent methyltransferase
MHSHIRTSANSAGFREEDGTLVIISCGAQDALSILEALRATQPPVDTIVSVLTLCSVPSPERAIRNLVRDVLKPGGNFLFYEHVLSHREDVAWWQRAWAPIWAVLFDGCRLDTPSNRLVDGLTLPEDNGVETSAWSERRLWGKDGESEENVFWHQVGKYVKRG